MYHILDEIKNNHNLDPAIAWAREYSQILDSRGSNLEFELRRLQYTTIFLGNEPIGSNKTHPNGSNPPANIMAAAAYGHDNLANLHPRYFKEIVRLLNAVAFWQNVPSSPYSSLFYNESAWDDVATSFTREFCALLGMSANSPLYTAATAGAIALPVLRKIKSVLKNQRTEWNTDNELPHEIPLPPSYNFHSIFVCPVSKEQATDSNPPMMLPCGHVLCLESIKNASKGTRFKCPYCPIESHPRDARQIFL
jgi:E3 ubiquitin-protein transferase RMND5